MSNKTLQTELLIEKIITCPKRNKRNHRDGFSGMKMLGLSILAVFGLLVVVSNDSGDAKTAYPASGANAVKPRILSKQSLVALKNRTLPSNIVFVSPAQIGGGSLNVSNGTSHDAYIKLVDPKSRTLVAAFYVKSNSSFMLKQIPDGVYQVLFVSGTDWDSEKQSFTRSASFSRFDRALNFVTTQRNDSQGVYTRYTVFKLTLHPVAHGNARTSRVNAKEFTRY
jgi:hypothetical protein